MIKQIKQKIQTNGWRFVGVPCTTVIFLKNRNYIKIKRCSPRQNKASKPRAVVRSQATVSPAQPEGFCFAGTRASPKHGRSRACRRGQKGVTLQGRHSWLKLVLWKFCQWLDHRLGWPQTGVGGARHVLTAEREGEGGPRAVLCLMIHS